MLTRCELLVWFLGAWLASAVVYGLLKRRLGTRLPSGAVAISSPQADIGDRLPGTQWSRSGIIVGMGVNSFLTIFVLFLTIFDLWSKVAPLIAVDLPALINWIGIAGIWVTDAWSVAVTYYNVNYVPANRPMREGSALLGSGHDSYILATGGPYRWIRHPMYVGKILFGLFLFLATGIWLTVFSLIAVASLPAQTRGEDKLLHDLFGPTFDDYVARTGRFLPKIRKARIADSADNPQR